MLPSHKNAVNYAAAVILYKNSMRDGIQHKPWGFKSMMLHLTRSFSPLPPPPRLRHQQTWVTGWASCCHRWEPRPTQRSWHTTTSTRRGSPASSMLPRLPYSNVFPFSPHKKEIVLDLYVGVIFKGNYVYMCVCSLMQRRYSEPNTYIDTPPSISHNSDELYDDVASIADPEVRSRFKSNPKKSIRKITLLSSSQYQ